MKWQVKQEGMKYWVINPSGKYVQSFFTKQAAEAYLKGKAS